MVTSLAKELEIELVYLPPYSPNLNLIERLWKFAKGKLRVKYYGDFKSFVDAAKAVPAFLLQLLLKDLLREEAMPSHGGLIRA